MTLGVTARARRKKKRTESKHALKIRALVAERDGYCRVRAAGAEFLVGECKGVSEWAHYADSRRFKTRGLPPEQRHSTAGSLMLCSKHHAAYDRQKTLVIIGADCNEPLQFQRATSYDDRIADAPRLTCSACLAPYDVQTRQPIPEPYICLRCR